MQNKPLAKPKWLRVSMLEDAKAGRVRKLLAEKKLETVCSEARCPNLGHCFSRGTATFLIMGNCCTRYCRYCAINDSPVTPAPLDVAEPTRLAEATAEMGLSYVVITSVTRDDLPDGGAMHFARTIDALRERIPNVQIEILVPDFQGKRKSLEILASSPPDVFNHNIETVESMFTTVRPEASYSRSLKLLRDFKEMKPQIPCKSGIMLGIGEDEEGIRNAIVNLLESGVSILTLGQYLQPTLNHWQVDRYVTPEEFDRWKEYALGLGFGYVSSAPLVRSSFHAEIR